ncbi:hypothetical protein T07_5704 [Trichinella nelsoni]|uniref:Uncharacterized protein n=1 Tax=Trichinella nelsoni TaxID=6336 RepID=A0A0V0RCD2_9BILA|nr:hypothetical protein T07_5704 [Trichinella nelsoni]
MTPICLQIKSGQKGPHNPNMFTNKNRSKRPP